MQGDRKTPLGKRETRNEKSITSSEGRETKELHQTGKRLTGRFLRIWERGPKERQNRVQADQDLLSKKLRPTKRQKGEVY